MPKYISELVHVVLALGNAVHLPIAKGENKSAINSIMNIDAVAE
jgi:hypothetical protein